MNKEGSQPEQEGQVLESAIRMARQRHREIEPHNLPPEAVEALTIIMDEAIEAYERYKASKEIKDGQEALLLLEKYRDEFIRFKAEMEEPSFENAADFKLRLVGLDLKNKPLEVGGETFMIVKGIGRERVIDQNGDFIDPPDDFQKFAGIHKIGGDLVIDAVKVDSDGEEEHFLIDRNGDVVASRTGCSSLGNVTDVAGKIYYTEGDPRTLINVMDQNDKEVMLESFTDVQYMMDVGGKIAFVGETDDGMSVYVDGERLGHPEQFFDNIKDLVVNKDGNIFFAGKLRGESVWAVYNKYGERVVFPFAEFSDLTTDSESRYNYITAMKENREDKTKIIDSRNVVHGLRDGYDIVWSMHTFGDETVIKYQHKEDERVYLHNEMSETVGASAGYVQVDQIIKMGDETYFVNKRHKNDRYNITNQSDVSLPEEYDEVYDMKPLQDMEGYIGVVGRRDNTIVRETIKVN